MTYRFPEGWTAPIEWELTTGGAPRNLAGFTVALVLTGRTGTVISTVGKTEAVNAALGQFRYNPAAGDLKASESPYQATWKATDTNLRDQFFPQQDPDVIEVWKP